MNRRAFLKKAAVVGGVVTAPLIVPSSVLGRNGTTAPSNRITMGAIGLGGRGTGDLRAFMAQKEVQFVAVCDVQRKNRERGAQLVNAHNGNTDCAMYRDLRDLLARKDIDAVLIATGDRWHAPASIMAMRAGKDVYCEKPGALTIAEGQALVATEQRYGRIFQTGAQRASERNFVIAGELVRSGLLGEVKLAYAHIGYLPNFPRKNYYAPAEPEPAKEDLDWDLWLGSAPWRDYNPAYVRTWGVPGWYTQKDFATGMAMWGSHTILQCQLDLSLADTSAVEYTYTDEFNSNAGRSPWLRGEDVTDGMHIRYDDGVEIIASLQGWSGPCGVRYIGSEGWVSVADGYGKPEVSSPHLEREFNRLVRAYTVRTQRPLNHVADFLNCVRTRRTPVTPASVAHRTMTTNLNMDTCLDLQRDLKWDPQTESFVDDAEANRLRSRAARKAWMAV
jgi:predicted dehydrogenase